jgi:hypothetical protein
MWLASVALVALCVVAAAAKASASDDLEGTCPAGGCVDTSGCAERGFDPKLLICTTCDALEKRLVENGLPAGAKKVLSECKGCCRQPPAAERFTSARLIADASIQEKDQDLHDFVKRKAPKFPSLEVEYMESARPAIELFQEEQPDRIVRAEVQGWGSDHIWKFLSLRLEQRNESSQADTREATTNAWTAEVQSCSG